jgi:hypothetical protein
VLYLDKPLRAHTLFQAVCRTNRRWTNPVTHQEKLHGLVVDYVGMGTELAKAVAVRDTGDGKALPADTGELVDLLAEWVERCMARFAGIDRHTSGFEQLYAAQERLLTRPQGTPSPPNSSEPRACSSSSGPKLPFVGSKVTTSGWPASTARSHRPMRPTSCCGSGSQDGCPGP